MWDDYFLKIAEAELQTVAFRYGFAELFKKAAKENIKATVEVPNLRLACQVWINIATAAASSGWANTRLSSCSLGREKHLGGR